MLGLTPHAETNDERGGDAVSGVRGWPVRGLTVRNHHLLYCITSLPAIETEATTGQKFGVYFREAWLRDF